MSKHRPDQPAPACYAIVHPGLEDIAADEITRDLGGEVKKSGRGIVAFRLARIDSDILRLRTTEDVFLLAWGSDDLTFRASVDLDRIRQWTRHAHWENLLRFHHAVHPKPKGKPTYRLVTQMEGKHGYRRADAAKMLAQGLEGVFPASWKPAEENASVEVWLTIHGKQAVCGLRLSDKTMRHRTYKQEHLPASLRPTVAAGMVRLAGASPGSIVLDPMCGAGTILAEQAELAGQRGAGRVLLWGGDIQSAAVRAAAANLKRFHPDFLAVWDAPRLPLPTSSVDRIVCNLPFGKQLGDPTTMGAFYGRTIREYDRVLKPGGRAVLLVADMNPLRNAVRQVQWQAQRQVEIRILGQPATISVWRKPIE
jgi:23S rRNA G2445 N2-methylase RlmL